MGTDGSKSDSFTDGNLDEVLTKFGAYIPASLLALLVAAVFVPLQGYGPENALRRFHIAAVNNDFEDMKRASLGSATPAAVNTLRAEIYAIARSGGSYRVQRIEKRGTDAIAAIDYSIGAASRTFLFVLRRDRGRWFVDPDASIALMMQKFGPPANYR